MNINKSGKDMTITEYENWSTCEIRKDHKIMVDFAHKFLHDKGFHLTENTENHIIDRMILCFGKVVRRQRHIDLKDLEEFKPEFVIRVCYLFKIPKSKEYEYLAEIELDAIARGMELPCKDIREDYPPLGRNWCRMQRLCSKYDFRRRRRRRRAIKDYEKGLRGGEAREGEDKEEDYEIILADLACMRGDEEVGSEESEDSEEDSEEGEYERVKEAIAKKKKKTKTKKTKTKKRC